MQSAKLKRKTIEENIPLQLTARVGLDPKFRLNTLTNTQLVRGSRNDNFCPTVFCRAFWDSFLVVEGYYFA